MVRRLFLMLYYGVAYYLPSSYMPLGGVFNRFRVFCVKHIFKKCGHITTIDTHAYFGNGANIEIGDESGIGAYNHLPNDIKIGNFVMMGPDIYILRDTSSL